MTLNGQNEYAVTGNQTVIRKGHNGQLLSVVLTYVFVWLTSSGCSSVQFCKYLSIDSAQIVADMVFLWR